MSDCITVTSIHKTCNAQPSQWEGVTDQGRVVYVHYRWGELTVYIDAIPLFYFENGGENDGVLSYNDLIRLTHHKFIWPLEETEEADEHGS